MMSALALLMGGCGAPSTRFFPLRAPVWRDADLRDVSVACSPGEKPGSTICRPKSYESSFAWDGGDNLVFRPVSQFFAVSPGGEAVNVNSLDEVPDSSWFTNRIGRSPMRLDAVVRGACPAHSLDTSVPDGSWLIDMGKNDGANPGFRIQVAAEKNSKYMLKGDLTDQPERATAATAIASRLYYAAGWFAPCDSVVYFKPEILTLKPGLKVTDNTGITRPFDSAALETILGNASHRGPLVRMGSSKWLDGRTLGPFTYAGRREDDPNDVIPHEDRRDLRGAKVIAAWLNHFDSREQNSMTTWVSSIAGDADASPGHTLHYYLDLGDCFGSEWAWEAISRRLGHANYFDFAYVAEDFVTLGIPERPWERAQRSAQGDIFGFYSARDFKPDLWRGGYPNPAFGRMTEHDAAWASRIIARFTPEMLDAVVRVGNFTEERHHSYLLSTLLERQRILLTRYLSRLSPITDLRVEHGDRLCGVDLARRTLLAAPEAFRYDAAVRRGERFTASKSPAVSVAEDGSLCVTIEHGRIDESIEDASLDRYVIVDLRNGWSRYLLRAHLYDLGPGRGFFLAGIERPESNEPPG